MPQTPVHLGPFNPTDERQIADVISCLGDPEHSLASVAERHNTSIQALTLWMQQPEIAARLDALESAFARMLRIQVADALPSVVNTLVEIVRDTLDELAHIPKNPHSVRALEQRSRARETGRKAAHLLVRLARFSGGPPRSPRPKSTLPTPSPTTPHPETTPSQPEPQPQQHQPWSPPEPKRRELPSLEEVVTELRSMGFIIEHPRWKGDEPPSQAGDETPSPSSSFFSSTSNPRVSFSPSPSSLNNTPSPTSPNSTDDPRIVLTIDSPSRPADNQPKSVDKPRRQPRRDAPDKTVRRHPPATRDPDNTS